MEMSEIAIVSIRGGVKFAQVSLPSSPPSILELTDTEKEQQQGSGIHDTQSNGSGSPKRVAKKSCSGLKRKKRKLCENSPDDVANDFKKAAKISRPTDEDEHHRNGSIGGNEPSSLDSIRDCDILRSRHDDPTKNFDVPSHLRAVAKKSCSRKHERKTQKELELDHSYAKRVGKYNTKRKKPRDEGLPFEKRKITEVGEASRKKKKKNVKGTGKVSRKSSACLTEKLKKLTITKQFEKPPFVRSYAEPTTEMIHAVEEIVKEMEKSEPCLEALMRNMWTSFPYRKHLYEKMPNIGVVFEMYPALTNWIIFKRDFELFKRASFEELDEKLRPELDRNFSNYESKYLSSSDYLIQTVLRSKDPSDSPAVRESKERDLKIMCFAYEKMGGHLQGVLYYACLKGDLPAQCITPCIVLNGDYGTTDTEIVVCCEGRKLTRTPNLYEAIMCIYATYWIFNLCYEKVSQPLFESFDNIIGE